MFPIAMKFWIHFHILTSINFAPPYKNMEDEIWVDPYKVPLPQPGVGRKKTLNEERAAQYRLRKSYRLSR